MARDICSVIVVCGMYGLDLDGAIGILNSFGKRNTLWVDLYDKNLNALTYEANRLLFCKLDTSEGSVQPPEEQARLEAEVFRSDPIRWTTENADRSWIKP